ncbi:MAG: M42 family peptidase [Clostridia bacterium]|nr:M42 family peptidase [Clostridia bacterium]
MTSKHGPLAGTALLEALSLTFGPSGCEEAVAALIEKTVADVADEIVRDRTGGIYAVLRGTGKGPVKRVMLSAHMDEVGFMVSSIEDDGTLRTAPLSARDPKILAGQYVTVGDGRRLVPGVIGVKPIHLKEKESLPAYSDLFVDVGANSREEAEKIVKKGDFGTFRSDFVRFGQNGRMLKGKAIDDRLGCAVLCDTVRAVKESGEPLPFDLYAAFTCREELGISGAGCAAGLIRPDIALVFEATAVADVYGVDPTRRVAYQGKGGAISYADRGTVYDRELVSLIFSAAEKNGIPAQPKKYVSGGNDSAAIRRSGEGVRAAAISAPSRYIHTASNVIREDDFLAIEKLAPAVLRELAKEGTER